MRESTTRPDLAALTARLADFDRRLDETRQRSRVFEAKTAAFHLGYVTAGAPKPMNVRVGREGKLYPLAAPR